uniref:Reverse transcriptase Ty1/copia-type domain-containing protein n=1 Tax=Tanacetum cinerariifolium TaxID=118510 RepID=A0A6L2P5K3_TANCI|nr:hypothetical protein [Tanacetum cinerariifolium]
MAAVNDVPQLVDKKGDDIIESVISCVLTKETWADLVHSFEGSLDTKENKIMDLKLEYQTFRAKSTESLSHTYTRYKILLNELANDGFNLSKHEINVGFVNSFLEKWLTFSQGLRNANHTQTLDLANIYGRFVYKENLIQKRYSNTKKALITNPSSTAISTAFFSNNIIQDFQENSDDEVDERSSEGYLRDLDIEYHERAFWQIQNSSPNSSIQADPKFQKDYKAEYKKMKVNLSLLEASPSSSQNLKTFQPKNKGFVAETFDWDEEEVSNDKEVTRVKVLMALDDDELIVGKSHARNEKESLISAIFMCLNALCLFTITRIPDISFFVSKVFRVFNIRRQQIEETYHVTFDESMEAIGFTHTSKDEIRIDYSFRDPLDEFIHEDDPSRQYQIESDISYYVIPHGRSLSELTQENQVPKVIAPNKPDIPHAEDTKGNNTEVLGSITEALVLDVTQSYISNQASTSSHPIPQDRCMVGKLTAALPSECLFADFLSEIELKKVSGVVKHPGWVDVMQEELNRFYIYKVYTLVPLPYVKTAIWSKWEEVIDYDETFTPTARMESIMIFLAFATYMNFKDYQMDVKSAFLNGKLKEEVYVKQPPGFKSSEFPDYVCKLDKALYGQKQAPKACPMCKISVQSKRITSNCYEKNPRSAKKQQSVAMSSAEAKYVAAAGCCASILWMKSQLSDYDIHYKMTNNVVGNFNYPLNVPAYKPIMKFLLNCPSNKGFTNCPSVLYQNYLKEFWSTAVAYDPFPSTDETECDLVTKLLNKSRLKYVSYPIFISCALQVLLGSDYTQDIRFGYLPAILSNSNFTKDPSRVTNIELTAHMIAVNNQRDSVSPLYLSAKPKKGKSQTVTPTLPKSQGPKASEALSKKSKKPKDKDSGGNKSPADMEPLNPTVVDPSGTGANEEDILGAGEEIDEDPQAAGIAETHHQSPLPQADKPRSSHAPSTEASDTDSSCDDILKKYDNTLPLTKRQLVKYLRKVSTMLFDRIIEDNWEKHKEAAVNYVNIKESINEYYDENIVHRDQTDKLVEASAKIKNAVKDDPVINKKINRAAESFTKISTNITKAHALKQDEEMAAWAKSSTNMASNVEGENNTNTATEDRMSHTKEETDANRQEKEVYYLTAEQLRAYMDKEEKIKKAEEEAKLFAISKPAVIKVVWEEAKKLEIHLKEAITTKAGEKFKKAQDAEHEPVVITVFRGADGRNFDVHKPFAFDEFGVSELDELREIILRKKNAVVQDLMNSLSRRKKRKHIELELEIKIIGLECNRALLENVPLVNNIVIEEPEHEIFFTDEFGDQAFQNGRKHIELELEIKIIGLECNRSLLKNVPLVNNMVIEEPEHEIFFTDEFGDQAFQRWSDIDKVRMEALVSYLVAASIVQSPENARFSMKQKNSLLNILIKRSSSQVGSPRI